MFKKRYRLHLSVTTSNWHAFYLIRGSKGYLAVDILEFQFWCKAGKALAHVESSLWLTLTINLSTLIYFLYKLITADKVSWVSEQYPRRSRYGLAKVGSQSDFRGYCHVLNQWSYFYYTNKLPHLFLCDIGYIWSCGRCRKWMYSLRWLQIWTLRFLSAVRGVASECIRCADILLYFYCYSTII